MYKCEICKKNVLPQDTMTNVCNSCEDKLMNDDYDDYDEMHLNDNRSHEFSEEISNQIYNIANLKDKNCKFCNGKFDKIAHYYKHESGYKTNYFYEKIWIWFNCVKCNHQWSLTHLGVSRKYNFKLNF